MRLIEFGGVEYHVTLTIDFDVYGNIVEFRRLDDPSGHVLVRVTGWDDPDDSRVDVALASDVDPRFAEFAVEHARRLIGEDQA